MISRNKNVQAFYDYTQKQANILGVNILLSKKKYITISKEIKCAGFFSSNWTKGKPVLTVATGKRLKHWLPIFVHESCHMEQWMESHKSWEDLEKLDVMDEWLSGKDFDKKTLNKSIKNSINIESDCEKRTIQKIKDWELPIDIDEYIQKANAYILFYNYVKKVRRWSSPHKSPYKNKRIYKHMPKKWLDNYHYLEPEVEKIFDKELKLK